MANIQLKFQDIVKQANIINNQLADIKTVLLQFEKYTRYTEKKTFTIYQRNYIILYIKT